jgi:hypothetical protein
MVSTLGWVDHGSVWQFDPVTESVRVIDLSDADHLVLAGGTGQTFTALHNFHGKRLVITAQSYSDPGRPLASVDVHDWAPVMSGDPHAWDDLSRVHVGYLDDDATGAAGYFLVRIGAATASLSRLDWFGDRYDHMYQSVIAAVEVPENGNRGSAAAPAAGSIATASGSWGDANAANAPDADVCAGLGGV